jgi:hypothetical protein
MLLKARLRCSEKSDVTFHGLEDDIEEVSRYFLVSKPKLDLLVHHG